MENIGYRCPLATQQDILHQILKKNEQLYGALELAQELPLTYYIGAGCIAQTVWNVQTGNPPAFGISDIDFVYYDPVLDLAAEDETIRTIRSTCSGVKLPLDIKNQARVHLWYRDHFGYAIVPYPSLEAAVDSWPTTATAVGVRLHRGLLDVYAPYGLNDLFGQIIRANKMQITQGIYEEKAKKWLSKWETLTVIPW